MKKLTTLKKITSHFQFSFLLISISLLFYGCNLLHITRIEKRHYTGGFYVEKNTPIPNELLNQKEILKETGLKPVSLFDTSSQVHSNSNANTKKNITTSQIGIRNYTLKGQSISKSLISTKHLNQLNSIINNAIISSRVFLNYSTINEKSLDMMQSTSSELYSAPDITNETQPTFKHHNGVGGLIILGIIFLILGAVSILVEWQLYFIIVGAIFLLWGVGDIISNANHKKQEQQYQEQQQKQEQAAEQERQRLVKIEEDERNKQAQIDAENRRKQQLAEAEAKRQKAISDSLAFENFKVQAARYRGLDVKPSELEEARKYIVQASALIEERKYDEAIEWYEKAISLDPLYPVEYYNYGILLGQQGSYEKAILAMKKYILLVPNAPNARTAQDKIYLWEFKMGK